MFGKLIEHIKFPTKNYVMYPLVRYSFCKNSSKYQVFWAGIQNVFHPFPKAEKF